MARPKEFDRDAALEIALKVFKTQGYEGTTTDDLRLAMKIGRQSLYDTYGDKHQLYLEALRLYSAQSIKQFTDSIVQGNNYRERLESALASFANQPVDDLALGCMGISAVCEFGQSDGQVTAILDVHGSRFSEALESILVEGKANGEFRHELQEADAAQFLLSVLSGMKISARAGASPASLTETARLAVKALTV